MMHRLNAFGQRIRDDAPELPGDVWVDDTPEEDLDDILGDWRELPGEQEELEEPIDDDVSDAYYEMMGWE